MEEIQNIYAQMGIDSEIYAYGEAILKKLADRFRQIDEIAEYNQLKVINAMQKCQVSEACLLGTSGYGYNDLGRDTLEAVYAKIFHTEDALVRPQITCGTHALALALIVDNVRWGKNFFRSGFYIPVLISGIVSGFIWKIMYNYNFGTFNAVLGSLGLDKWKQDWLGNSSLTLLMIGVVLIWKGAGYYMIIYLASLQSVSTDIIEAASIDGAAYLQRLRYITLPLLLPAITTSVVLNLIGGLKLFGIILATTSGGPGYSSHSLSTLINYLYFQNQNAGYSSSVGLFLFLIIMILGTIVRNFLEKKAEGIS